MLTRRAALACAPLSLLFGTSRPAGAQTGRPSGLPASTMLVTHSSPGGGSDVFLREMSRHLQPILGTSLAVENLRGGSGAQAIARVARARPDGATLYATTPTYIQTSLLSRPEFTYESLDPLVVVFLDPEVLYTRTESPHRTLADLLTHARSNRQRWGAANPASLERIALERLNRLAGTRATVVSHEGGGDLMINVLNGTLDVGIGEMQELGAQLEAGRIRALGVLTEARLPAFPELPTVREAGVDLTVTKFRGLAGPKGIPDEVAGRWEAGLRQLLEEPAYRAAYSKEALVPRLLGRAEARSFTTAFAAEVATSLRELGVLR